MLKYCPWGKFSLDRAPLLRKWIQDWLPNHTCLAPEDWFTTGHDLTDGSISSTGHWEWRTKSRTYLWDLPPGAADAALEQLRIARIKRQASTHVVLVPKLFTHLWRKQLIKCCDAVIEIPPIHKFWTADQFENLTIGICLPFLPHRPWQLRHTPKLFSLEREMSRMFKIHNVDGRSVLLQFFNQVKAWYSLSPSILWSVLHFKKRSRLSSDESNSKDARSTKRARQIQIGQSMEEETPEPK